MTDLRDTIIPKSDQLNADDLIVGPITIKITSVKVPGGEQPVSIHYEGDNGKPWKPCKSSLRTLIAGWKTSDGDKFIGRQVTLYLDSDVTWAGQAVGGIRVSHMSHIEKPLRLMLTKSRGKKASHEIGVIQTVPLKDMTEDEFKAFKSDLEGAVDLKSLKAAGAKIGKGYDTASTEKLTNLYRETSKKLREAK